MSFLENIFGNRSKATVKAVSSKISLINSFDEAYSSLSDEELKAKTPYLKELLQTGKGLDDILPEAFATVREASKRVLNMRHFDVQLIGGIMLHLGKIAEMRTKKNSSCR